MYAYAYAFTRCSFGKKRGKKVVQVLKRRCLFVCHGNVDLGSMCGHKVCGYYVSKVPVDRVKFDARWR